MKAIRVHAFGGPEVLRWEDATEPGPGPGQVLVRVRAAGVNPVDTYIRSGAYGPRPLPFTPGMDAAGVVESLGAGVSRLRAGQRVYTAGTLTGAYAELSLCEEAQVRPLPDQISFAQGAAIYVPCATAYRALFHRARAARGETVLVHGASGGVGIAAVQLARAAGLTVIGTAGTERGRELARREGAHHVLDHATPGCLEELAALTGGRGVDIVLEMSSHLNLGKDLTALARGGRVVVIGSRGTVEVNPRDLMSREAAILGMVLMNASPAEREEILSALEAALEEGALRPVVGRELPMAEAAKAHEAVLAPGAYGKIVLLP